MTASMFLFVILLVAAIVLAYFLIKIHKNSLRHTEKRFNFYAMWSCVTLISLYMCFMLDSSVVSKLLLLAGIQTSPPTLTTQLLVTAVLIFYIWTAHKWSIHWRGLRTYNPYDPIRHNTVQPFFVDGFTETIRIVKRLPPTQPYQTSLSAKYKLDLPSPVETPPFHLLVRDLILGKWTEYVVDDDAWIEEAKCWYGEDTSLEVPLLIACALRCEEFDIARLRTQVAHCASEKPAKIIVVLEEQDLNFDTSSIVGDTKSTLVVYGFDELVEHMLPLARYRNRIDREFRKTLLPNAEFALSDIVVDTRIRSLAPDDSTSMAAEGDVIDFRQYIFRWLEKDGYQHIALLGDYGQGKSTAALELTYHLLHDGELAARLGNRIPLLVRLTGLSPKSTSPEALLGAWGSSVGLNGRALLAMHAAGRTLLIFDAFDEMANVADRSDRLDHFGALWKFASESSKIVFTGRPNFFLDNEELKRMLGISEFHSQGPYCSAVRIEPFSLSEIRGSLRWMPAQKAEHLVNTIEEYPRLREIAVRPSLLFQLSQLWHQGRLELDTGDVQSASIIKQFVTYSIERQMAKQRSDVRLERGDRVFIRLRESELTYFTAGCAAAALDEERSNTLPEVIFRRTISNMWDSIGEEDNFARKPAEIGALSWSLRERLSDEEDPIEICQQVVRTHGVIELDPTQQGVYKFSHKSFAEAMAAAVIAAGAIGDEDVLSAVWKAMRPINLIRQFVVFQFCYDFAKSYLSDGRLIAEHRVYSNISLTPNNVATRLLYYFQKSFFVGQLVLSGGLRSYSHKVGRSRQDTDVSDIRAWGNTLRSLASWRAAIPILATIVGAMSGLFLMYSDRGDVVEDRWLIIISVSVVSVSLGASMVAMTQMLGGLQRLILLISYMFSRLRINEERPHNGRREILERVLINVVSDSWSFSRYAKRLW